MVIKKMNKELKLKFLLPKNDFLVALGTIVILAMLIIPLPAVLLDFLMIISVTMALLMLLVVLYVDRSYDLSVFPSLLLLITVFRLALNVSSTRLILLQGASFKGQVVRTFGDFVVGGNYVVGFIIFIILIAVQFIVITKGSTRTAEVAARFSLDSLPGKQMSIDSDLASGLISEREAEQRRKQLRQESDFFGSMDGAAKFIRGDVQVGLIITFINIAGGFIVGMLMRGESFQTALQTYTLLSVGDGLVAQVPSLLVAVATGLIVTRSVSDQNIGQEINSQFKAQPRIFFIGAFILILFLFVPGFPKFLLVLMAGGLFILGYLNKKSLVNLESETKEEPSSNQQTSSEKEEDLLKSLFPLNSFELQIGYKLIPLVDSSHSAQFLSSLATIRKKIALELGVIIPAIKIRDNLELAADEYSFIIKGAEVIKGSLRVGLSLALKGNQEVKEKLPGREIKDPVLGLPSFWISSSQKEEFLSKGYLVYDNLSLLELYLTEISQKYAGDFLGREEVSDLLEQAGENYPSIIKEVKEKFSLGDIQGVLQKLLKEKVSIRNLGVILELLVNYPAKEKKINLLVEYVRAGLNRQITNQYISPNKSLAVITVANDLQSLIREAIYDDPVEGRVLALDPDTYRLILKSLRKAYKEAEQSGKQPVFLVSSHIRRALFDLLEREIKFPVVLSYSEINKETKVEVISSVQLAA